MELKWNQSLTCWNITQLKPDLFEYLPTVTKLNLIFGVGKKEFLIINANIYIYLAFTKQFPCIIRIFIM